MKKVSRRQSNKESRKQSTTKKTKQAEPAVEALIAGPGAAATKQTFSLPRTRKSIEKRIKEALIEMLHEKNVQHAVRLGIIKELRSLLDLRDDLTRKPKSKPDSKVERNHDDEEFDAALADVRVLLIELASAKARRVPEPEALGRLGEAGAADAEG